MNLKDLIAELKRRSAVRVAIAYLIASWVILQPVALVAPALNLPGWILPACIILLGVGFPIAVALGWLFEPTRDGFRRVGVAPKARKRAPARAEADANAPAQVFNRRLALFSGVGAVAAAAMAAPMVFRGSWRLPFAPEERVTLAVLPFADLSAKKNHGYFADGVAEEILSLLSRNSDIKVIGRTSSQMFRGGGDLKAIGDALHATHVLEGSVRTDGNAVRISVRLLRVRDSEQLWSEDFDRPLANIFAIQEEVGHAVADRLGRVLKLKDTGRARRTTPEAYDRVLAARSLIRRRNKEALLEARALLQQALSIDPNYALGYALLAQTTLLLSSDYISYGDVPIPQAHAEAKRLADRALELDPNLAEGWVIRGQLLEPSTPDGLRAFRRAAELDPGLAEAWVGVGQGVGFLTEEAIPYFRKAVEAEPLWMQGNRALVTSLHRHPAEAERVIASYLAASNDRLGADRLRFWAARQRSDGSVVVATGRRLMRAAPIDPIEASTLSFFLMDLGFTEEALRVLPASETITRLAFERNYDAVMAEATLRGADLWLRGRDARVATKVMASKRRWGELLRLYDARYASPADFYAQAVWAPDLTPGIYLALKNGGRTAEADDLLARLAAEVGYPGASDIQPLLRAQLLALQGRPEDAIREMDRAVDAGWRYVEPPEFATFIEYAAFEGLRSDPRFLAVLEKYRRRTRLELAELAQGR